MQDRSQQPLYDYLLVQKSINQVMPYDVIEKIIADSIAFVKANNINARIANVVFNINNKLVLAQVYVERKNAYAAVRDSKYGTSPTAYNVQVRFPFGLETSLGDQAILLPGGDFENVLQPFASYSGKISDDVQRDTDARAILCSPGISAELREDKNTPESQIVLSIPDHETVAFSIGDEKGVGYENVSGLIEYIELKDYNAKLKMHGLYPLFYSAGAESKAMILRRHAEYQGYTEYQYSQNGKVEPRDSGTKRRLQRYNEFLARVSAEIIDQPVGKRWLMMGAIDPKNRYTLNISIINGITLYTKSGLPVTRLRDYQLELLRCCLDFFNNIESKSSHARAATIDMSVGAGKTFVIYTLLQYLIYRMQTRNEVSQTLPPFCMAPDVGVANVTKQSIDKQGVTTGTSAIAISSQEQMPNAEFLHLYEALSHSAQLAAKVTDDYIQTGLQDDILAFCHSKSYFPLTVINLLFSQYNGDYLTSLVTKFKDSIDVKRLLLIAEGQKTVLNKTGMLGIEALSNLLEQFTAIRQGIASDYDFREIKLDQGKSLSINYNQDVMHRDIGALNITKINEGQLRTILEKRWKNDIRSIREALMRMAFLVDKKAALLLANSGGLGNTYTVDEMMQQIKSFLPLAVKQLTFLANKKDATLHDHYTLYTYLREVFTTIPSEIYFNNYVSDIKHLFQESINFNLQLIQHIEGRIATKIKELGTIAEVKGLGDSVDKLNQWGVRATDDPIRAANQLAGIVSLSVVGHALADDAKLLLSHISVFTPEGLACYFEYLAQLEGRPKIALKQAWGVYRISQQQRTLISKNDISDRLRQVLKATMIADEIHKDEFRFLFDKDHPVHRRIDAVILRYLGKAFSEVLPPRIGMSGTINQVANNAFGGVVLYNLSIQKMISRDLVKKVHVVTNSALGAEHKGESKETKEQQQNNKLAYAKQVVIDYFGKTNDLFKLSKGLIFSKVVDQELNDTIAYCFNLLIQEEYAKDEDRIIQAELFSKINQARQDKQELNPQTLKQLHRTIFFNNIFAIYLEYVLSKSSAPKEFSDIIGLQNKLHHKGQDLQLGILTDQELMSLIRNVDPKSITKADVTAFINARIKDPIVAVMIIGRISECKNDSQRLARYFSDIARETRMDHLITSDRNEFESGKTLAMLGGKSQQTGYSHEPVGIVVDVSFAQQTIEQVNQMIDRLRCQSEQHDNVKQFLTCLTALADLAEATFSYDEKNQIGGRALRTPYGHVWYIQYQSNINAFLAESKAAADSPMAVLKIETQFEDIFTANEVLAKEERASITFNRYALSQINKTNSTFTAFYQNVSVHFAEQILDRNSRNQYNNYLNQRLPLLWAMKHQQELAHDYFKHFDPKIFADLKQELSAERSRVAVAERKAVQQSSSSSSLQPGLLGGATGLLCSSAYMHSVVGATALLGVSAGVFMAACTVIGAAMFILVAAIYNYRNRAGSPRFFPARDSSANARLNEAPQHAISLVR